MELQIPKSQTTKGLSFCNYLKAELQRGYLLENDEERYAARREKVYTFFKIPREIEKFLAYGFFQCADSFLFVVTFLPVRFCLAVLCFIIRTIKWLFGYRKKSSLMKPAEIVDLLKGMLLIICCFIISYIDTSMCYHIIKTQSTIKLYLFFNMLEIADKLMSAFGQDTLDALFWTATEPRDRKHEHFGLLFHLLVTSIYVIIHSTIVLLQALTLNVAINSDNKGLLTIVISNNFVELKGAVFKKFDRNNLLQISCSDVRERFHICTLLFVVVIQTLKEYTWKEERLWILLPDCLLVMGTEVLVDWLKHAFITRFNDIPIDVYRDYRLLIASDLILCKQKYAYSDHSDLVARRMGFIPIPLGVVIYRILSQSLTLSNVSAYIIFVVGFLCVVSFRVLNGIVILGKSCDLINNAELERSRNVSECVMEHKRSRNTSASSTNVKSSSMTALNATNYSIRRRNISGEEYKSDDIHLSVPLVKKPSTSKERLTPEVSLHDSLSGPKVGEPSKSSDRGHSLLTQEATHYEFTSDNDNLYISEVNNSDTSILESSTTEEPSLGFWGESQSTLMANSMVNLASVGINQGISDNNLAVIISDDASFEHNSASNSPVINGEDPFHFQDRNSVGFEKVKNRSKTLPSKRYSCPEISPSAFEVPNRDLLPDSSGQSNSHYERNHLNNTRGTANNNTSGAANNARGTAVEDITPDSPPVPPPAKSK